MRKLFIRKSFRLDKSSVIQQKNVSILTINEVIYEKTVNFSNYTFYLIKKMTNFDRCQNYTLENRSV